MGHWLAESWAWFAEFFAAMAVVFIGVFLFVAALYGGAVAAVRLVDFIAG